MSALISFITFPESHTLSTLQYCLFIVWLGSDIIGSLPKAFPNKILEFWPIPEHRTDAKVCRLPCLHLYYLLCANKKMLGLRSRLSDEPNALTYLLLNHFWAAMTQESEWLSNDHRIAGLIPEPCSQLLPLSKILNQKCSKRNSQCCVSVCVNDYLSSFTGDTWDGKWGNATNVVKCTDGGADVKSRM